MNGASKLSYDFTIIENNLKTNGKSPKEDRLMKACSQLLKNTERVILKEMPLDNEYEAETIRIFPIIIVHDSLYSAPALNYWIYYWFIDKLETLKTDIRFEGFDFNRIMPLTIIEIDILILYQQCFVEKQFDLLSLIENYQQFVRFDLAGKLPPQFVEEHAMKSALSFSEFVRNQAHNLNIEIDFKIITPLLKNFGIS